MAGYQTIEALRPILHRGPPATPVLDRMLFYKPFRKGSPTAAQLTEMRSLRQAGWSINQIAAKLDFWPGTVHRYIRDMPIPPGVQVQKTHHFTEKDIAKAGRMRRAGFTWVEIGEELKCGRTEARRLVCGDERDRSHELRTAINEILGAACRATGVTRQEIRSSRERGGKACARIVRARHIIFWIAVRRAGMSNTATGKSLGFDHSSVGHGLKAVDPVANAIGIADGVGYQRIARLLWEAEWPKASA